MFVFCNFQHPGFLDVHDLVELHEVLQGRCDSQFLQHHYQEPSREWWDQPLLMWPRWRSVHWCHGIFTSMTLLEIVGNLWESNALETSKKHHQILASQVADNDLSLFDSNSLNSIRASIISWVSIVPFPSRSRNVKSDLAASSLSSRITFHRKSHW